MKVISSSVYGVPFALLGSRTYTLGHPLWCTCPCTVRCDLCVYVIVSLIYLDLRCVLSHRRWTRDARAEAPGGVFSGGEWTGPER